MKFYTSTHLLDTEQAVRQFRLHDFGHTSVGEVYLSSKGTWYVHWNHEVRVMEPRQILVLYKDHLSGDAVEQIVALSGLEWESRG